MQNEEIKYALAVDFKDYKTEVTRGISVHIMENGMTRVVDRHQNNFTDFELHVINYAMHVAFKALDFMGDRGNL